MQQPHTGLQLSRPRSPDLPLCVWSCAGHPYSSRRRHRRGRCFPCTRSLPRHDVDARAIAPWSRALNASPCTGRRRYSSARHRSSQPLSRLTSSPSTSVRHARVAELHPAALAHRLLAPVCLPASPACRPRHASRRRRLHGRRKQSPERRSPCARRKARTGDHRGSCGVRVGFANEKYQDVWAEKKVMSRSVARQVFDVLANPSIAVALAAFKSDFNMVR